MLISSNKKKMKIKSFNDGLLQFGKIKNGYDENGDATVKEFVLKNELFFSFSSIREEDLSKYDSDHRLVSKVETYLTSEITTNDVVRINDTYYDINHIDPSLNQISQFIYLDSHVEDFKFKIEILCYERVSPLQDPQLTHLKTEWCDIVKETSVTQTKTDQINDLTKKVVFAIPYSEDLANNFKKLNNIRLRYKSNLYKCIDFNNLEALDKVIELTCEAI